MLPNLPALTDQWETEEFLVQCDTLAWVQFLPADPCRWFFSVSAGAGGQFLVSTAPPDFLTLEGALVGPQVTEFEYKKYGPRIGLPWFVSGKGANFNITVFTSRLKLTER